MGRSWFVVESSLPSIRSCHPLGGVPVLEGPVCCVSTDDEAREAFLPRPAYPTDSPIVSRFFKLADIRRDLVLHLEVFVLELGHRMSDRGWQSLANAPLVTRYVQVKPRLLRRLWATNRVSPFDPQQWRVEVEPVTGVQQGKISETVNAISG